MTDDLQRLTRTLCDLQRLHQRFGDNAALGEKIESVKRRIFAAEHSVNFGFPFPDAVDECLYQVSR